jgi:pimeloyl-ACP methyl ester carboxylesterase
VKVVLVHGLGVSHRYFARLRRLLPAALAPDLDGASVEELTASLAAVAPGGALLVANSLGCQVAAELAARRPGAAAALVLIGPTWDPSAPTVRAQLARLAHGAYREPPSLLPVLAWEYARWGPRRILRTARSMLAHPVAERLAEVTAPVVVVRGAHDPICGATWARLAASLPAAGRLVEVTGAAHAVHWSHPFVLAELVEELEQQLRER